MPAIKLVVVGAGAWGTALAIHFASRHQTALWVRNPEQLAHMREQRINSRYLPGFLLPDNLELTEDLQSAATAADVILLATPTPALRETLIRLASVLDQQTLLWACKGFESGSMQLPHRVIEENLPGFDDYGVISGPSFASEVARGLPTALTLASHSKRVRQLAGELHHHHLRMYTSQDVIGVETGGALKNVIAIAAGISDGLQLGHNARAALISRGLAEITRMGVALGGQPETFMGLTGMGDLILTATSDQSRNRQVGLRLAAGQPLNQILGELGHIAEGVNTAVEVSQLAKRLQIDMPIVDAVQSVVSGRAQPAQAVEQLLNREPGQEWHD